MNAIQRAYFKDRSGSREERLWRAEKFQKRRNLQIFSLRNSENGTACSSGGYPPPPRISGIIELAGNRKLNLAPQSLRGKILVSKNLVAAAEEQGFKTVRSALRRTVTASTMSARTCL